MFRVVQVALVLLVGAAAWWNAPSRPDQLAATFELVDQATGRPLAGLIQLRNAQGELVPLPKLLNRGTGVVQGPIHDWSALVEPTSISLPPGRYELRGFSGLETDEARANFELRERPERVRLELTRFYDAAARGLQGGNTHLHLMKQSRSNADRYLTEIPRADGLDLVFVSYLERDVADLEYTTNKYTRQELRELARRGIPIGWGEEHRHNFAGWGQGYGHVMFLNIPELVYPVSIGPGIMNRGTDGLPLQVGIDRARELGGTIIWCHDQWGYEDLPNWLLGRLHATNIFDGGIHGSYAQSFYRYLNAGLRVAFSTGTDWFQYDFNRVYVPTAAPVDIQAWLDSLVAGRSFITNGPLADFTIDDQPIGATVALERPGQVRASFRLSGRIDFEKAELLINGRVVETIPSQPERGHFVAEWAGPLAIDEPCWISLRTPPVPWKGEPDLPKVPLNELGRELFFHTSPVFVTIGGRGVFQPTAAESLLVEMQDNRRAIAAGGKFADDAERDRVLAVHDAGIRELERRIAARRSAP